MEEELDGVEVTNEQQQKLLQEYANLKLTDEKQCLCRFYLRGLCVFPKGVCKYSHGIDDLQFKPYNGQPIVWQYKKTDFNQLKLIPKEKRYRNLYEFQKEKVYTEDQINNQRKIRSEVRDQMMRSECEKFMDLLDKIYPEQEWTEKFIQREFTRAGFNKPTSTLSFKKICEYLCSSVHSRFMLGKINGKSALIQKLSNQEIDKQFGEILKKKLMEFDNTKIPEQEIKRLVFQQNSNARLPPLNHHLKSLKMSFLDYIRVLVTRDVQLQKILEDRKLSFQSQPNTPELTSWAIKYLQTGQKIILIDKFVSDLVSQYKLSNNNAIGPVRVQLANKGFRFYYMPMITFIYNRQSKKQIIQQPCTCKFKQKPDLSCLIIEPPQKALQEVEVIDSDESFDRCCWEFLSSKVLAVDIEGRLRKGGFVEIIQFNNGKNVFLFDIYAITQVGFNFDLYEKVKLIIKQKMLDPTVLKIFHDSRHDCLSLHQIFNTCTLNVFDTSGMQIFKNQSEVYENTKQFSAAVLGAISNVRTPGLNELLKKYEAPHGINESKDQFHRLMSMGTKFGGIFHERPLHPEYKKYCVKDVLDLIHVYERMRKTIPDEISMFIGDRYVQNAYESTL